MNGPRMIHQDGKTLVEMVEHIEIPMKSSLQEKVEDGPLEPSSELYALEEKEMKVNYKQSKSSLKSMLKDIKKNLKEAEPKEERPKKLAAIVEEEEEKGDEIDKLGKSLQP